MRLILCMLLFVLVAVTTGYHAYFVWKRKDRRTLGVQAGLAAITIAAGIFAIYHVPDPSISKLFNAISPFAQ